MSIIKCTTKTQNSFKLKYNEYHNVLIQLNIHFNKNIIRVSQDVLTTTQHFLSKENSTFILAKEILIIIKIKHSTTLDDHPLASIGANQAQLHHQLPKQR